MKKFFKAFLREEDGAELIEYAIVIAIVAVIAAVIVVIAKTVQRKVEGAKDLIEDMEMPGASAAPTAGPATP
jgi:Flp pilus assembly pilin Flp